MLFVELVAELEGIAVPMPGADVLANDVAAEETEVPVLWVDCEVYEFVRASSKLSTRGMNLQHLQVSTVR